MNETTFAGGANLGQLFLCAENLHFFSRPIWKSAYQAHLKTIYGGRYRGLRRTEPRKTKLKPNFRGLAGGLADDMKDWKVARIPPTGVLWYGKNRVENYCECK